MWSFIHSRDRQGAADSAQLATKALLKGPHQPLPCGRGYECLLLAAAVFVLLAAPCHAAETEAAPPAPAAGVLRTVTGGSVNGVLMPCDTPYVIRWSSDAFAAPLQFPVRHLSAIHLTGTQSPPACPPASPDTCFELVGGDVIFGSLLALSEETLTVDGLHVSRLELPRENVWRFSRYGGGSNLIYAGPNGIAEWRGTTSTWMEEGGDLLTELKSTYLVADLHVPARACIEIELSWKKKADFILALGMDAVDDVVAHAFRLEAWQNDLVLLRESAAQADVASVHKLELGAGTFRARLFLDQVAGRMLAYSPDGRLLATVELPVASEPVHSGIRLENRQGDIRLERLRVSSWDGETPRSAEPGVCVLRMADGTVIRGELERFDPLTRAFLVREGGVERKLEAAQVEEVVLGPPHDGETRGVRAVYSDGTRVSGDLLATEEHCLMLALAGVAEPVPVPLAGLQSVISLRPLAPPRREEERVGHLELDGTRLSGWLTDGSEGPDTSCLSWRPSEAAGTYPLRHGVKGRIVYRELPPPTDAVAPPEPRKKRGRGRVIVLGGDGEEIAEPKLREPVSSEYAFGTFLDLRSGDRLRCRAVSIDAHGVTLESDFSERIFVAHEHVKAVGLKASSSPGPMEEAKRERLLTLPRAQRGDPPSHLIRCRSGDFLRGRVIELNEEHVLVEVRMETIDVPRERVGSIIWLHADQLGNTDVVPRDPTRLGGTAVHAVANDGTRVMLGAERVHARTIHGTSLELGSIEVPLGAIDQLLLGSTLDDPVVDQARRDWRLHGAKEPRAAAAGAGAGATGEGRAASPLVGRPAPEFSLSTLAGGTAKLSDFKGSVVVLDFWATWCGPCLRALPAVSATVAEFGEHNVRLVTVNLDDRQDRIGTTLERLKLDLTVALDSDGGVAHAFGVTAIPQTVVIDREGKVTHVFVGDGSGDELRAALRTLLGL